MAVRFRREASRYNDGTIGWTSGLLQTVHLLRNATRALNFPTAAAALERNATPCCAFTDLPKITGLLTLRSRLCVSGLVSGRHSRTGIRFSDRTLPNPVGAKEYRVRSVWEKVTSLSVSFEKRWWMYSSIPAATAADYSILFLPLYLDMMIYQYCYDSGAVDAS